MKRCRHNILHDFGNPISLSELSKCQGLCLLPEINSFTHWKLQPFALYMYPYPICICMCIVTDPITHLRCALSQALVIQTIYWVMQTLYRHFTDLCQLAAVTRRYGVNDVLPCNCPPDFRCLNMREECVSVCVKEFE